MLVALYSFCVLCVAKLFWQPHLLYYWRVAPSVTLWRIIFHWFSFNFLFTTLTYFYLRAFIFICQNLFSSVRISIYLSEPISICVHLYLSVRIFHGYLWESLFLWSSERIYFFKFLWKQASVFYHQNTIMIFYSFYMFQFYVFYFIFFSFCVWLPFCWAKCLHILLTPLQYVLLLLY